MIFKNTYSPLCKRNTIGYYYNDNGILVKAQPYELRPSFTYINNVAVVSGYMIEPLTTNNPSSFNEPNNNSFFINNETCNGFTDDCGRWGFLSVL